MLNLAALERDLATKQRAASELLAKTAKTCNEYEEKDQEGKVTVTGRLMTPEERNAIQAIIDEANGIKGKLQAARGEGNLAAEIEKLTAGMSRADANETKRAALKSLGQQWVESDSGKFFFQKRHHGTRNWASPVSELEEMHIFGATLTEDPASGGKLIVPDYRPGVLPLLFKPLTVRSLLAQGSTDSNVIIYMVEKTFVNMASPVAEGAVKPESSLVFDQATDSVTKIAHWLPVTEEMLEDVAQIRSYIDARLRNGLDLTEEDQLLNGNGTPPNMRGILNRVGLTPPTVRTDPDTNADAIFRTMMKIFNLSFVMPDGHVLNPANWETISLSKDTTGRYFGGGPFGQALVSQTLWGLPVAVTPSIVANTALTGAFGTQAQVFDRGGVRVEASNSHQDFFIKNLVAIRAERREALAVYRPAAFGTTTGLT